MTKETRKERNRLAAKQSRDNKTAYIHHLEKSLEKSQQRCYTLEMELQNIPQRLDAQYPQLLSIRDIMMPSAELEDASIFFTD